MKTTAGDQVKAILKPPVAELAAKCLGHLNLNVKPARQRMWSWMMKCLWGLGTTPGSLHYLFGFLTEVRRAIGRVDDVNERLW